LANWLKTGDTSKYYSYDSRREDFARDLQTVEAYLNSQRIGPLTPTSFLVTYINHLECEGPSRLSAALDSTLAFWRFRSSKGWLPDPDKLNLQLAFPFPNQRGRLNAQVTPAIRRRDRRYLLKLELTAQGTLEKQDPSAAMAGLDAGHEWIVRGFADMTSEQAHQKWGRTQ
jgi:uncharacterized protein (TIGR04255 family)